MMYLLQGLIIFAVCQYSLAMDTERIPGWADRRRVGLWPNAAGRPLEMQAPP